MTKPIAKSNDFDFSVDTVTIHELLDSHWPVGCVREIVTADEFDNKWQFELYKYDLIVRGFATAQDAMDALVKKLEAEY